MSDRPILFSAQMVRAILDGHKTQTRRVVKVGDTIEERDDGTRWPYFTTWTHGDDGSPWASCPYGEPGDRLWVRESFVYRSKHDRYYYKADHEAPFTAPYAHGGWKPSIHMPRAASRLTLDVTAIRVERLQAISGDDAKAEGAPTFADDPLRGAGNMAALSWFRSLWDDINGDRASWESNPWVWVVEFSRVEAGPAGVRGRWYREPRRVEREAARVRAAMGWRMSPAGKAES